MKKIFFVLIFVATLIGCATTKKLDNSINFTGEVKEDYLGNRYYNLLCDKIMITGSVKTNILAAYISEITIGENKLTGKISEFILTTMMLNYGNDTISGKIKPTLTKEIIDLQDGDMKITGEITGMLNTKKYVMKSDKINLNGEIVETMTGYKVNLSINAGTLTGQIKKGLSKNTYNLQAKDIDDYGIVAFVLLDILRYREIDEKQTKDRQKQSQQTLNK